MALEKLMVMGNGNIMAPRLDDLGVALIDDYLQKDRQIRDGKIKGWPLFSPQVVSASSYFEKLDVRDSSLEAATEALQIWYESNIERIISAPFGHLMTLVTDGRDYWITDVARKDFPKPGLAADYAITLKGRKDNNDVVYLVLGTRRKDPGRGKLSLFGGFRNVEDGIFDSAIYTALKEGFEEGNVRIDIKNIESLREDYTADEIDATFTQGGMKATGTVYHLGTFKTSDKGFYEGGELLADGTKRVYLTDLYSINFYLGSTQLDEQKLSRWFSAGDDISSLAFMDITSYVQSGKKGDILRHLEFGIDHHKDMIGPIISRAHEIYY
jgi:hypothetical protein